MLSRQKLQSNLMRFFASPSGVKSHKDAEDKWAAAYHEYAVDAVDASGDQPIGLTKSKFRELLNFRIPRNNITFARMLDLAFQAYWAGTAFSIGNLVPGLGLPCPNVGTGTMIFATEATSVVSTVIPGVMVRSVAPVLVQPESSVNRQAYLIARAMHEATKSAVIVTIVGVDTSVPTPLPVTNTCTVF